MKALHLIFILCVFFHGTNGFKMDEQTLEGDDSDGAVNKHWANNIFNPKNYDIRNSEWMNSNSRSENSARPANSRIRCAPEDEVSYVGAVLEYEPYMRWTSGGGEAVMMENIRILVTYATEAKNQGADIFVVPEYALTGLWQHVGRPEKFKTLTQVVPDPTLGVVPCTHDTQLEENTALRELSCTAAALEMYMVVDLGERVPCPAPAADAASACANQTFYNTQVVFDRSGAVVARYRKQNLYLEPQYTSGPEDDASARFTTDFGVTFSLQVCFDITYEHPGYSNVLYHGVTDVVMSTAWVDETPFLLSINVFNGWSIGLGTNLLVSGYHLPEMTKVGSGIFCGYSDKSATYIYDPDSGDALVVSPIVTCASQPVKRRPVPTITEPKIIKFPSKKGTEPRRNRYHRMLHDNLAPFNRTILETTLPGETKSITLCHNDSLCCHLEYEHSRSDLMYQFMAFSGNEIKGAGTYIIYGQVCSVIWCESEDWETCGRIDRGIPEMDSFGPFSITGDYNCEYVFPVAFRRDKNVVDNHLYEFVTNEKTKTYKLIANQGMDNILSATLFGRWYSRDPPK